MKQTCPICKEIISIDENLYQEGETVDVECPVCGNAVVFTIHHEDTPKKETQEEINPNLMKCPECGSYISKKAETCPHCGVTLKEPDVEKTKGKDKEQPPVPPAPGPKSTSTSGVKVLLILIIVLMAVGGIVFGVYYYNSVYLPEQDRIAEQKRKDDEAKKEADFEAKAERYYTFADVVNFRTEKVAGVDYNRIATLPYGKELIMLEYGSDWSRVRVYLDNGEKKDGYISTPFIMSKKDFFWQNSIWGDSDSKTVICTAKCRKALFDYFKKNSYVGDLSSSKCSEYGIPVSPSSYNKWQVFSKPYGSKYNTSYYKRLINSYSKFTDFAVIIKNIQTGDRKLLYFYFDDDETPHFYAETDAPRNGYIKEIYWSYDYYYDNKSLHVEYTY